MKAKLDKFGGINLGFILKTVILGVVTTSIFILLFSVFMYLSQMGYEYATVFATVALATGTFVSAFYAAKKIGNKGFLTGIIVGLITFLTVTVISLIVDKGSITSNTLFHFIIIMLSALIGGIMGVNRAANKKYI